MGMGRERKCCSNKMGRGGTSWSSPPPGLFPPLLHLGLEAVIQESWEQVPVLSHLIPFPKLPVPGLPISHHVLLPRRLGERYRSECMRLREEKAGKAQARGRYRGGIGGRSNSSPSGCTYLHRKSRMTSQLGKLAWGGEGES